MAVKIEDNKTILFVGDSITDCGRMANERPLGCGYVKIFSDFMIIRETAKNINIINKGIGGHKVTDLQIRWTDDVLRHKPDYLSIKIGINDLHSLLRNAEAAVNPELFEKTYDEILQRTQTTLNNCKILLIDPFYLSLETSKNSFRKDVLDLIPKYIEIVHKMSEKYNTKLVKTHDIFQNLLKYNEVDTFCMEPVHPNQLGHLTIAESVYKTLSE